MTGRTRYSNVDPSIASLVVKRNEAGPISEMNRLEVGKDLRVLGREFLLNLEETIQGGS